jgi:hypothetical protein
MRAILLLSSAALFLAGAGCNPYSKLPANKAPTKLPPVPAGAECIYAWKAQSRRFKTYWDDQQVTVACRGHFPRSWRKAGDEAWEVSATTQKGIAIPCLGVLRRWPDSGGREQTEVLPPFDLEEVSDGLYLVMDTKVKLSGDPADPATAPQEIRPMALLIEIRNHCVKPFQVDIPLVPEKPSGLTPAPIVRVEEPPRGTSVPLR